jgi:hypothetical protein
MCAGAGINWAIMGALAFVKTKGFSDQDAMARWDWFGLGASPMVTDEKLMAMLSQAVQVAASCERLEDLPGLTFDDVEAVLSAYEAFLRWSSAYLNVPLPARPPAEGYTQDLPEPQPLKKSSPKPPPPKQGDPLNKSGGRNPVEPVKDAPSTRAPWLKTLGRILRYVTGLISFASALVATVGWLLPPQIAAPIKALLPFLKPLLHSLCAYLPECSSIP